MQLMEEEKVRVDTRSCAHWLVGRGRCDFFFFAALARTCSQNGRTTCSRAQKRQCHRVDGEKLRICGRRFRIKVLVPGVLRAHVRPSASELLRAPCLRPVPEEDPEQQHGGSSSVPALPEHRLHHHAQQRHGQGGTECPCVLPQHEQRV